MRITTKAVYQMTDEGLELIEEEGYEYEGPLALAGGGKGGGDIPENTTTTVTNQPWWAATPHLYKIMKHGEFQADTPMTFPSQTYAGFDPLQTQSQQARLDYDLQPQISQAQAAQASMLSAPDIANNPWVQGMGDVVQRRLNRNLEENILPALGSQAIGRGQYGSTRQGIAEGIASRGTQEAYADALAKIQSDAYGQGLDQQARGMAFTPQTMQQGMLPAQIMGDVGAERRAMTQMGVDESVARHEFEQMEPWQRLQMYNQLVQGGPTDSTTTGSANYAGGGLGNALGGAMTGIGAAQYLSGPGLGLFGGTPTIAGLGSLGTMGLYGLGGALLGGLFS